DVKRTQPFADDLAHHYGRRIANPAVPIGRPACALFVHEDMAAADIQSAWSLQGPPNTHSRHPQGRSNLRRPRAVLAPLAHRLDRHGWLAALADTLHLGGFDTNPLAFPNEAALPLGNHAQHSHEDAAGVGRGAELRLKHTQPRALLFKLMHEIEN